MEVTLETRLLGFRYPLAESWVGWRYRPPKDATHSGLGGQWSLDLQISGNGGDGSLLPQKKII